MTRVVLALVVVALPSRLLAQAEPARGEQLIATLVESLGDPDAEVRVNVATALANLGEVAVPALVETLAHPRAERRVGAALALGRMGPEAKAAIPALLKALKDKEDVVRREASYALSRIVTPDAAPPPVGPRPAVPPPDPPPGQSDSGVPR